MTPEEHEESLMNEAAGFTSDLHPIRQDLNAIEHELTHLHPDAARDATVRLHSPFGLRQTSEALRKIAEDLQHINRQARERNPS